MSFTPKSADKYFCEKCDFKCCKHSDWIRHIDTRKHSKETTGDPILHQNKQYFCNICNKEYKSKNGLWKHKKSCNIKEEKAKEEEEENKMVIFDSNSLMSIIKEELTSIVKNQIEGNIESTKFNQEIQKQNQDFQKQNLEFQQQMFNQIMEMMKTSLTTNNNIVNGNVNNNYNQFNLQVYLNETCKNAMTITQFLDYLEPTVEELEATAYLGYVEGISRIIMRGFKNLEEHELPFHCTDLKREHIYIKNPDDEWVEEKDEKPILLLFIKEVARKSFKNLSAWQKKNPNWANYNSKQNDLFNKIVGNSMSGATEEEQQENYEKIMKNIMKNIVIDKSKKNKCK